MESRNDINEIIQSSTFKVEADNFAYVKVAKISNNIDDHFMVSRDADEITVITKEENLFDLSIIERNKDSYGLIALNVSVPFYAVGFLATVSEAIANENMNVFIVSTYSKDYMLVKHDKLENVKSILLRLGFKEK